MKLKLWKMVVSEKDWYFDFWDIGQFQMPIRPKEYCRKQCTWWFSEPFRPTFLMHNSLCALFTVSDIWAEVNIHKNGENCGKPQNEGKIRIFILSSARSKMLVQPTYFFVFSFLVPKQYLRIIGCMCTCYCRAELGRNWSLKKKKKGRKNRDFFTFLKICPFSRGCISARNDF